MLDIFGHGGDTDDLQWQIVEPNEESPESTRLQPRGYPGAVQVNNVEIMVFGGEDCSEVCLFNPNTSVIERQAFGFCQHPKQMPFVLTISGRVVTGDHNRL